MINSTTDKTDKIDEIAEKSLNVLIKELEENPDKDANLTILMSIFSMQIRTLYLVRELQEQVQEQVNILEYILNEKYGINDGL